MGTCTGGTIIMRPGLEPAERFVKLSHKFAHERMRCPTLTCRFSYSGWHALSFRRAWFWAEKRCATPLEDSGRATPIRQVIVGRLLTHDIGRRRTEIKAESVSSPRLPCIVFRERPLQRLEDRLPDPASADRSAS
jgi:hypothetical protein